MKESENFILKCKSSSNERLVKKKTVGNDHQQSRGLQDLGGRPRTIDGILLIAYVDTLDIAMYLRRTSMPSGPSCNISFMRRLGCGVGITQQRTLIPRSVAQRWWSVFMAVYKGRRCSGVVVMRFSEFGNLSIVLCDFGFELIHLE